MSSRLFKILGAAAMLAALPWVSWMQHQLTADRGRLGLTRGEPLENAPPLLAFTTVALGGFRGLVANALWMRAVKLQDQGNYFEMVSLADWITKLQPDMGQVWAVQAWNMTYNISIQFSAPQDRWLWVRSGIELLRDQGLRYNPRDPLLYRELAWFYQDKLGKSTDKTHLYFKQAWAAEMVSVLGAKPNLDELIQPRTDEAKARARTLRERYKLDPAWMKHVDGHYGPFDWRLPEAHAIYWAEVGLRDAKQQDLLILRRVIWQSMQLAFLRGRLMVNPVDQSIDFGPNLEMMDNANRAYEEMKRAEPDKRDYIGRGQRNFLRSGVYFLFTHNRMAEAARWFKYAKEKFPESIAPGTALDEFVVEEVNELVGEGSNTMRVRGVVEGLLGQYFYNVALGEDDQANGHAALARKVWERYQEKITGEEKRIGLPSLSEMRRQVLAQIARGEHGFTPAMTAQLQARRGTGSETNAPPR